MKTANTIENEINLIRLEIYEETKNLTPRERAEQTNRIAESFATQFGFKIASGSLNET